MGCISVSGTGCAAPTTGWATSRALACAAAALLLVGASPVARLELDVAKLRSARGMLRICLTADPANFPSCVDDARAVTRSVPARDAGIVYDALPPGDYAIAVIHDENGNARLDTLMGIPREGFGFSRNPAVGFGPPRFAAARFTLYRAGGSQQVRMRYLL
jgi:uncharacterized protein (DUF2141 family)